MGPEEKVDLRNLWGLAALGALFLALLVLIDFVPLDLGGIGTRSLISLGLVVVCIILELVSRKVSRRMLAEAKQVRS